MNLTWLEFPERSNKLRLVVSPSNFIYILISVYLFLHKILWIVTEFKLRLVILRRFIKVWGEPHSMFVKPRVKIIARKSRVLCWDIRLPEISEGRRSHILSPCLAGSCYELLGLAMRKIYSFSFSLCVFEKSKFPEIKLHRLPVRKSVINYTIFRDWVSVLTILQFWGLHFENKLFGKWKIFLLCLLTV